MQVANGAVGILGGSGLYGLDRLDDVREVAVSTPYGEPSAPPLMGRFADHAVVFIPRHGRGHPFLPSEVNFRANIYALKRLGVTRVISVSAVGSMREEIRPGDLVVVDQFIDRTVRRASTFFGDGCAGHVSFAEPVCPDLSAVVLAGAREAGLERVHVGGTYLCIEGPQFSTRAESLFYRQFGVSVIGMTGATEAKLCREAELCFSLVALATDYDCWHPAEQSVTARAVLDVLRANVAHARNVVKRSVARIAGERHCACATAAQHAILTDAKFISPDARERLAGLYGRSFE